MLIDLTVSSDDEAPPPPPPPPAKRPRAAGGAAARPPLIGASSSGRTVRVSGDDDAASGEDRAAVAALARAATPYEDASFPADASSIRGEADAPEEDFDVATPFCACRAVAVEDAVASDSANHGRRYWRCATRRCGHFSWASGIARPGALAWARLARTPVVTDFGFSANDLAQGGLGDCWFLSALAVVAERHDLIAKLFLETEANGAGAYGCRLFMDGRWATVTVDDRLPVTADPRRSGSATRAVDGKCLAYARSRCAKTDGRPTLWASLLEKAYAKAHGSFRAISGGQIAEALLDLTGAPTFCVDLAADGFDSERLWASLVGWRSRGYPLGCATDPVPGLREVGLCGSHAYSITDARTVVAGGAVARLIRIRNPHGVGEWNGDWSDRSARWASVVGQGLERTGVDDGTFWMDFTHFLMGFSRVDVCVAAREPRAASFSCAFPKKKDPWRVATSAYEITVDGPTDLFVMALQPTPRGATFRRDRKRSYRPGDLQVVVVDDRGNVVGCAFRGADVYDRGALRVEARPGATLSVYAYALGANPSAAGDAAAPPFALRFYAPDADFTVRERRFSPPRDGRGALRALHAALRGSPPTRGDPSLAHSEARCEPLAAREGVSFFLTRGDGVLAVSASNRSGAPRRVSAAVYAKSAVARGPPGLLDSDGTLADAYYERRKAAGTAAAGGAGYRYPAKWKAFVSYADVPPGKTALVAVVVRSGVQYELGAVECAASGDAPPPAKAVQRTLDAFLSSKRPRVDVNDGVFGAIAFDGEAPAPTSAAAPIDVDADADDPAAAPPEAAADREAEDLKAALAASVGGGGGDAALAAALAASRAVPPPRDPDADLREALAASRAAAPPPRDPDEDLAEALRLSRESVRAARLRRFGA